MVITQNISIEDRYLPIIGEVAWHSIIVDPRIADESQRHYDLMQDVLRRFPPAPAAPLHVLEIACYAHTTGYRLAHDQHAQVTLFEISRNSLSLGRDLGDPQRQSVGNPRLVVGDFHALPFDDASFNVVYMSSALHHTHNYTQVLREMMRVLAPGGILYLENEPTLRGCCFYKFRCNRPTDFTPLETRLFNSHILRTVAEPYIGSRPEELFDMIENQQMPLDELIETLGESCDMEAMDLFVEQCLSPLEMRWLENRSLGTQALTQLVFNDLSERCQDALPYLTAREVGLGFSLPTTDELLELAQALAPALNRLPDDAGLPEFRYRLAQIFGSPVRFTARKRVLAKGWVPLETMESKAARFNQTYPQVGGIHNAFPENVRNILESTSLIPSLNTTLPDSVYTFFPSADWSLNRGQGVDATLLNLKPNARIHLPQQPALQYEKMLLVMRLYCPVQQDRFYRLTLKLQNEAVWVYQAFKSDSILIKTMFPAERLKRGSLDLCLELVSESAFWAPEPIQVALMHVGLFNLA